MSNVPFRLSVLSLACAMSFQGTVWAAEVSADSASLVDQKVLLPVIVVTASRQGTSLKTTPAAISKVSTKDIDQKHATFIGQLVNQTPGVMMNDLSNEQHMMSIRQPMTTAAVYQYLEDGLSIRPVGVFNHNALYELNMAGVGGIEILRGPASSLYGSNAVGGTINFLTRAPSGSPTAEIGVQGSSEGYRRIDLTASDTFDTAIGEQGLRLSGYASDRGDSWQDHAKSDKQSITLRHDWKISDSTRLKNILTYNHLYTDMPGSLNADDFSQRAGFSYQTFTYREVDATRISSQLTHDWSKGQQSQATLYYRDNSTVQNPSYNIKTDVKNSKPTGTYSSQTTNNSFQTYGLNLQHAATLGDVKIVVGAMAEHSPTKASTNDIEVFRDTATRVYTGFKQRQLLRDYDVDVDNQAIYAQASWAVIPTLNLVGGGRYDWISYDYNNHLQPSKVTGAPDEKRHYSKFSPKIGVIWNATPQVDVYSNWSQGFVPPEVSSQYGANLVTPTLTEATFTNIDAGIRFNLFDRRLDGEVTLYRLSGEDEVISYTKPDNSREPRNAGKTSHEGVELGGRWNFQDQYQQSLKLSGTVARHCYVQYRPSGTVSYDGNDMPSAPRVTSTLEYQIKPMTDLTLSVEGIWMGKYWINDANTLKYPGHALLNLRANYRHNAYEVYGQVLNVADVHYADSVSFSNNEATYTPGAPRTYLLGLRYHFGE